MKLKSFALVLSCAAGSVASAALAQPAAPTASTTVAGVTVQAAAPPKPATVLKETRSFVQTYAAPTAKIGQFARWHEPICVLVLGLQPAPAAQVAARVEDVAKAVGLQVKKPGCTPNIQIVFTTQPQRVLDSFAEHREQALGFHYPSDLKALKAVTRPVQAWYMTATAGGGGPVAGLVFSANGPIPAQTRTEVIDEPDNPPPTGCGDSHFSICLKSVFKNVLVVADMGRLEGKDLGLMTDYLALLALSQPRSLDGCAAFASVVDVLAPAACPGRDPPDGLTPADAAYLTSLYSADLEATQSGETTDIAGQMASILTKAKGGGR